MDIQKKRRHLLARTGLGGAMCALVSLSAMADDKLPDIGGESYKWAVDVYYENDTRFRGKDNTGNSVGLSKFRNTLQVEADRPLGDGWEFHGVLRGSFDGVYRMNDDEYGKHAGGAITLDSTTPGGTISSPHGSGPVNKAVVDGLGQPNNVFGFNSTNPSLPGYNPNSGLQVLGQRWHDVEGGVAFGVPVQPCDYDKRGCTDFGGYGDKKRSELESPEFNSRLDFIREAYVKKTFTLDDQRSIFLKVGKQQVVWGRTDLFRVLDVINPVDFSRNNIYDELQDIRIPMWMVQAEYRMGGSETMQERNLQIVWNFDQFRPNNLGQCGTANVILDAGCFFRGMKNLWDNGGTVSSFANVGPDTWLATDFGPGQIGLDQVHLPGWKLKNTQLGVKYEGVTQDGLSFSLNALTYRSQLPSLRGAKRSTNGFNGEYRDYWPYLISFDMYFPRVNLIGGSMDFEWEAAQAAVRVEAAFTDGEEFANTSKPQLYSKNNVFRAVVGIDRPTFIPFINARRTTLISGQLFYQHIFDHDYERGPLGPVGMPDWEDNVIGTLLVKAFLKNDRLSPQIIVAHDFRAQSTVMAPSVDWLLSDNLKFTIGANLKVSSGNDRWKFDDCRGCNPWPPFTAGPNYPGDTAQAFSRGLGGLEPLGRFRAGPIGAAWAEDEIFATLRYKF
ncbi:MAG: DUF1302 domain-containing protein [Gammaproteobacteria bacterium]|nr:DUF1302 domain-containing protein [Gammaproteobacteria bacterium]MBU0772991.1 DUF1302 domain-containing protein [Gammaproteobacteria bacterium]MBU0855809.1 DUF1302 domain-containing protein [Gammaproteobacteria bacterium]MBU1847686.1 DUF1302 domain-containing protein [Gammaproteobacteria bacterium]